MKRDSRPICKKKEKCKDYQNGMCSFSHPICKFGTKCSKPDCFFTHDPTKYENIKVENKGSLSKVPCKFGASCKKVSEGKCPFLHEPSGQIQKK